MYIVAFNGPPESGKDTLAQMLVEHMDSRITIPVKQDSLSLALREIAYTMVGQRYTESTYDTFKRTPFILGEQRVTGRQLMIDISEKFLKPVYGTEIMADLLIQRNETFPGLLLIRDSGFQIEVNPLIRWVGMKNLYIVQVTRPGKSFDHDSREWVRHPNSACQMCVVNDGSLDDLRTEAGRIYGRLVNQMGWIL